MTINVEADGQGELRRTGGVATFCDQLLQLEIDLLALWTTSIRIGDEDSCDQLHARMQQIRRPHAALRS